MNKKLTINLGIIFFIILVFSIGTLSASSVPCNPDVTIVNQDPSPAIPNSYVKLIFEVTGLGNCDGYTVRLNPEYPFSLDPDENATYKITGNPFAEGYQNTWMVPYKIRVAEDALEGEYKLKLIYQEGVSEEFSSYAQKNFNITVSDVQTDFATVIQDTSGTQVSVGIVNTGRNTANSLIVGIPEQENFAATGTNEQIVGNLASGDYTIVSFNVAATNQRNLGARNASRPPSQETNPENPKMLKIKLDYTDIIGKRRSVIKEVKFESSSASGNASTFTRTSRTSTNSSSSAWWYVAGIIVLLAIGALIYKGYHKKLMNKIKDLHNKTASNKKSTSNTPDWVSSERTHHKK